MFDRACKKRRKKVKKTNHKTTDSALNIKYSNTTKAREHDRNKLNRVKIMRQYMSNLFRNCIITHYCVFQLLEILEPTKDATRNNLHFLSNSKCLIYFKQRR